MNISSTVHIVIDLHRSRQVVVDQLQATFNQMSKNDLTHIHLKDYTSVP